MILFPSHDQVVTLAKLPHGTSSNDGKFLRANNGADPTFETVSSVGGATGVDFNDNVKARFGTGNDLSIFHNATNSFISNTTGILQIDSDDRVQVNATELRVKNAGDTETIAKFIQDGAVELYYNNNKKAETTNGGIQVTGSVACPSGS